MPYEPNAYPLAVGCQRINPCGYTVLPPASRGSSPLPCPRSHQSTQDLQMNTKDLKKLYHILSLPGASEPVNSVPTYSWKGLSSSGMVDIALKHVPKVLVCICAQSWYCAQFLYLPELTFSFYPTPWRKLVVKHRHQKLLSLHYFPKSLLPREAHLR